MHTCYLCMPTPGEYKVLFIYIFWHVDVYTSGHKPSINVLFLFFRYGKMLKTCHVGPVEDNKVEIVSEGFCLLIFVFVFALFCFKS